MSYYLLVTHFRKDVLYAIDWWLFGCINTNGTLNSMGVTWIMAVGSGGGEWGCMLSHSPIGHFVQMTDTVIYIKQVFSAIMLN